MTVVFQCFLVFYYLINAVYCGENTTQISLRKPRFLDGWLVRFENNACTGGDGIEGTCYTRRQCTDINGIRTGMCASGIGVCCVLQFTCGDTSAYNSTYFVNPGFPNSYTDSGFCKMTIQRCDDSICQARIDFGKFSLAPPNENGDCVDDAFYIIGGSSNVPVLCGENSGKHIYVDFNNDTPIQLILNSGGSAGRSWNIKVSQIPCDCPWKAPTGCLMYYTGVSGVVTSFNYAQTGNQFGTRQLTNQNYGVCIEMQPGYCSIRWSQSSGDPYSFTLTHDTYVEPNLPLKGVDCNTDFVVIPDPIYVDGNTPVNADRFCGTRFLPVTTSSKPFVMTVVTNGNEIGDVGNRGFSLAYTQQRCTGALLG